MQLLIICLCFILFLYPTYRIMANKDFHYTSYLRMMTPTGSVMLGATGHSRVQTEPGC